MIYFGQREINIASQISVVLPVVRRYAALPLGAVTGLLVYSPILQHYATSVTGSNVAWALGYFSHSATLGGYFTSGSIIPAIATTFIASYIIKKSYSHINTVLTEVFLKQYPYNTKNAIMISAVCGLCVDCITKTAECSVTVVNIAFITTHILAIDLLSTIGNPLYIPGNNKANTWYSFLINQIYGEIPKPDRSNELNTLDAHLSGEMSNCAFSNQNFSIKKDVDMMITEPVMEILRLVSYPLGFSNLL